MMNEMKRLALHCLRNKTSNGVCLSLVESLNDFGPHNHSIRDLVETVNILHAGNSKTC